MEMKEQAENAFEDRYKGVAFRAHYKATEITDMNIPGRGLQEDGVYDIRDVRGSFEDVKVTYTDQQIKEE